MISESHSRERGKMVAEQLAARGIHDARVLAAMGKVPRENFVAGGDMAFAYEDRPLSIGFGQTISQPFMVARATELAAPSPGDRALEVGAGCGYQTAVLSELCAQVYGIEVVPELAARAAHTLADLGRHNVTIACFDGSGGWAEHAPYDVIVVSAAAPRVPAMLVAQLAGGGRLVVPVGQGDGQVLTRVRMVGGVCVVDRDTHCRYVNLVGRYGVGSEPARA